MRRTQALLLILHPPISAQPIQARGGAAGCSGDDRIVNLPWLNRPELNKKQPNWNWWGTLPRQPDQTSKQGSNRFTWFGDMLYKQEEIELHVKTRPMASFSH